MKQKIKAVTLRLTTSEYSRNILSIFSANAFGQFLPIFTAPILTRIYSPSDYGYLGIFMSISGLISILTTMGYSNAIIIAESDEEAHEVVSLCLKATVFIVFISAVLLFVFKSFVLNTYQISNSEYFIYIIPFCVLLSSLTTIIGLLTTRFKLFKLLSINKIAGAIISSIISITFGLIFKNLIGLLAGFLIGLFFNSMFLYYSLSQKVNLPLISQYFKMDTRTVWKKFNNFHKYVLPAEFINSFVNQLPILVLSSHSMAGQTAVGNYNMSNRILGLPITLISGSIGEVFKQRATEDYNLYGTCRPIFLKTFKSLAFASILPFIILIFLGSDIFSFVFGPQWRGAGEYCQILGVMFLLRFVINPLTYVFYIANRQKLDFILHLLFIIFGFVSMMIGLRYFQSVKISLWCFSITNGLLYLVYFFYSYKLSSKRKNL